MLNNALDYGLTEWQFWEMTLAELDRYVESQKRIAAIKAKEKATFDYIHARLIGRAVGNCFAKNGEFPELYEAYPSLFKDDSKQIAEERENKKVQLSALRFKQFADAYNKKQQLQGVANKNE